MYEKKSQKLYKKKMNEMSFIHGLSNCAGGEGDYVQN